MPTCGTSARLSAVSGENKRLPMEQRLGYWLKLLHDRAPDSIGEMLHFEIGGWDEASSCGTLYATTEKWMQNAFGSLHGGIISTAFDQGMGMVASCLMEGTAITPTVEMNTIFHHFLTPGCRMRMKVYVVAQTRTMLHLRAEIMDDAAPEKLCASATAIFFVKPIG